MTERAFIMMKLPDSFLQEMRTLLGGEYDVWLSSCDGRPAQGLRIHSGKLSAGRWEQMAPFPVDPVPWTPNGYYIPEGERPSKDPRYDAGLYYIQEPSAMAPAALLCVKPGDRVLDLCAAPGGKSTELGVRLGGEGLLVSNDISHSRARALLRNLERFGILNLCVTCEEPEKLADTFGPYFDAVLVDAPCSGEGMFRKDPGLIKSWLERGPEYYAPIQRRILTEAVRMLKPGGFLLYSTCTFSRMEDEDVLHGLLEDCPEMELSPLEPFAGSLPGIDGEPVIRLFPHRIRGEGHFAALLRKREGAETQEEERAQKEERGQRADSLRRRGRKEEASGAEREAIRFLEQETDFLAWESMLTSPYDRNRMRIQGDQVYLLPEDFDRSWKLRFLRTGLLIGSRKGKRFEPSQAAAMSLRPEAFSQTVSFSCSDERVLRYLKGETVFPDADARLKKGWTLVCMEEFPIGWAKYTGTALKNKFDAGWRIQ
ncbi:MAG: RsmB/NOP family class I SAM-dependent RNA methyltransferase [Clostridiales bacterium]|nr:RsmB/NOP family class I SAM-dependent RNA methyltransferase [Clostridiales bacterium]